MKVERLTIDMTRLQRVFERVILANYEALPTPKTINAFLRGVEKEATVQGRDIVGAERKRLLKSVRSRWLR